MELSLIGFVFCFLHQILPRTCLSSEEQRATGLDGQDGGVSWVPNDSNERKQTKPNKYSDPEYEAELKAGDPADLFGSNQHRSYPATYRELGRRFVPFYPYTDKKTSKTDEKSTESKQKHVNEELIPIKVAPEKVLEVAMKSVIEQAATPVNNSEVVHKEKEILRTGDYWNSVWVEDVDPKSVLRSYAKNQLGSIKAKIMPGSKLYQLVSVLQQFSPRLLYVINHT